MATSKPRTRWRRILIAGGVLVLLAVGGVVWWVDQGQFLFFPKNWDVIEPGLVYRSGRIHRRLIEDTLKEHDIGVIVDLAASEADDPDERAEREAAERLGVRKVDLVGLSGFGTGDAKDYVLALKEIVEAKRAGTPILVHCAGGSERTGGVFACYRMLFQGWDGPQAWEEYTRYRVKPPERPDLPDFLNANLADIARQLEALGIPLDTPSPLPRFGPAPEAP